MAVHIIEGAGAPTSTPPEKGCHYIDTSTGTSYIAVDTASSADWKSTAGGTASISDTVYGAGWNADTTNAASKNALFDKIDAVDTAVALNTAKTIDDTAYNATSWDANDDAPTKNAVRDKFVTNDAAIAANQTDVVTTRGDIVRGSSGAAAERLAVGTAGYVLTSDGTDAAWAAATGGAPSDTVYGAGWNADTTNAASKNALFDKIDAVDTAVALNTAKTIDDTAYNATSWDANDDAATKNAIRDKFVTNDAAIAANQTDVVTTRGDIVRGSSGAAAERLGIGTNGQVLTSDGTDIAWANSAAGFSDPMTTRGDIIYKNSGGTTTRLAAGSASQVLTSDGTDISWENSAAGFSDPMTTRGDIIFKNSSGTTTRLATGTANQVLTSDGTDTAWASLPIDDTAYSESSWNTNTDAPTKNAVRDKFVTNDAAIALNTAKTIDNTAYSESSWNANSDAATKDAIRDKFVTNDAAIAANQADVITTRGDIIRGSSGAAAERLAVGTVNQFVGTDGTDTAWETPSHLNISDIGSNAHSVIDTFITNQELIISTNSSPTGFEDADATLGISTRTVTLSHPYAYWYKGARFASSGDATWTIPDTTGMYHVRFTDGAATAPTPATTSFDLENEVPVAEVYWNATTSEAFIAEERHTCYWPWSIHYYLHKTRGAVYGSGGTASGYVVSSDTLVDVQIALTETKLHDEDLEITVAAKAEGANFSKWYLSGATAELRTGGTTDTIPVTHSSNVCQWNEWTGSTWQLTNMTNNYYMNFYIIATNSLETANGFCVVPGQAEYSSLSAAEAEGINSLTLGGFVGKETVPLYKIQVQYRTVNTDNNARITLEHVEDLRGTSNPSIAAASPSNHENLTGLQGGTAAEYYHLTNAQHTVATQSASTSVNGYLSTTDWDTFNAKAPALVDDAYGGGWNGSSLAATRNAIYDKIDAVDTAVALNTAKTIDDTAYNATSWDANDDAATKNAIRDKFVTNDAAIALNTAKTIDDTAYSESSWNTNTDAPTKNAVRDKFVTNDAAIALNTAKTIDNTAYNESSWNANSDAATKDAIRDKFVTNDAAIAANQADVVTTRGDIIRGSSGAAAERLAIGTAGYVLTSDGTDAAWAAATGGAPSDVAYAAGWNGDTTNSASKNALFDKIDAMDTSIAAAANRTLDAVPTNGNTTNSVSSDGVFDQLATKQDSLPLTTTGDILYYTGSAYTRLARGTDNQVLTATATDINWENSAAGFADPMSTRGDIIWRASGGTTRLAVGTADQVLTSDGTDVSWEDAGGGGGVSEDDVAAICMSLNA